MSHLKEINTELKKHHAEFQEIFNRFAKRNITEQLGDEIKSACKDYIDKLSNKSGYLQSLLKEIDFKITFIKPQNRLDGWSCNIETFIKEPTS